MRYKELFELDRSAQLDQTNVDELEQHLNSTLFAPKSHIRAKKPVINIDLDKSNHFMDRAKERDMSVSDVERTIKKGYRQNWEWIKKRASANELGNNQDGKHFIDPEKNIDIPMKIDKTFGTPKTDRKEGEPLIRSQLTKNFVPKNTIFPKTIIDRSTSKDGLPNDMTGPNVDPKWKAIKKELGYDERD